jgi:hypothetical protein
MDALKYLGALQAEAQRKLNAARAHHAGPGEQIPLLQEVNSYDAAIAALVEKEILEREASNPLNRTFGNTGR